MYWSSKLKRALGLGPKEQLPEMFTGDSGSKRANEVLLANPAVHGNQRLVDSLLGNGETVFFRQGDKLIHQGGQDNCVYFLLSGEVDIVFKLQRGTIREAPNQVGEMAAIDPGATRSATVVARTNEVAALRVCGTHFNNLLKAYPRFQELLQIEMLARHRERIVAGKIARTNNSAVWFAISTGVGLVAGLASCYISASINWTTTAQTVVSVGAGLLVFLFTLLHNPAFFWKRTFGIVFLAMLGTFALDSFVSMEAKQGLGSLQVAIRMGDHNTEWEMYLVKATPFILVLGLCALVEIFRTRD